MGAFANAPELVRMVLKLPRLTFFRKFLLFISGIKNFVPTK